MKPVQNPSAKPSKVYFTDFHATPSETLPQKLHRISLICDVSPFCDCHAENDIPIIPDIGMLASFDPVALDQACVDLCNKMPVCEGSRLDRHIQAFGKEDPNHEYFHMNHPDAAWEPGLIHAEEIGLGTRQYELIKI